MRLTSLRKGALTGLKPKDAKHSTSPKLEITEAEERPTGWKSGGDPVLAFVYFWGHTQYSEFCVQGSFQVVLVESQDQDLRMWGVGRKEPWTREVPQTLSYLGA